MVHGGHLAGGDGFRCKFGDGLPVHAVLQGARSTGYYLECMSPAMDVIAEEKHTILEITTNDQQYTRDRVAFRYFSPQLVDSIIPITGPVLGGTQVLVRFESQGSSSDSTFYCRFGAMLSVGVRTSNSQVACPSPASEGLGIVTVSISTNAQQFSNQNDFEYFLHPVISTVSPASGPIAADTLVDIRGARLQSGSAYVCRFGLNGRTEATYDAGPPSRILCFSTPAPVSGSQDLQVSLNAQQFTNSLAFNYFDPPAVLSLSPSTGPIEGCVNRI